MCGASCPKTWKGVCPVFSPTYRTISGTRDPGVRAVFTYWVICSHPFEQPMLAIKDRLVLILST